MSPSKEIRSARQTCTTHTDGTGGSWFLSEPPDKHLLLAMDLLIIVYWKLVLCLAVLETLGNYQSDKADKIPALMPLMFSWRNKGQEAKKQDACV